MDIGDFSSNCWQKNNNGKPLRNQQDFAGEAFRRAIITFKFPVLESFGNQLGVVEDHREIPCKRTGNRERLFTKNLQVFFNTWR